MFGAASGPRVQLICTASEHFDDEPLAAPAIMFSASATMCRQIVLLIANGASRSPLHAKSAGH